MVVHSFLVKSLSSTPAWKILHTQYFPLLNRPMCPSITPFSVCFNNHKKWLSQSSLESHLQLRLVVGDRENRQEKIIINNCLPCPWPWRSPPSQQAAEEGGTTGSGAILSSLSAMKQMHKLFLAPVVELWGGEEPWLALGRDLDLVRWSFPLDPRVHCWWSGEERANTLRVILSYVFYLICSLVIESAWFCQWKQPCKQTLFLNT